MNKSTISNFDAWPYEAQDEIQRVATEKKFGWIMENFFIFFAFSAARKCTKDYINAVNTGETNIPCVCGYHPSRRKIRTIITEATVLEDLKNIAKRFLIAGTDNEAKRSAHILLEILNTVREELKQPKFLRMRYLDSEVRSEKLPKLMLEIIRAVSDGKISVKRADDALIEIKLRYETVFSEMGINLTSAQAKKK